MNAVNTKPYSDKDPVNLEDHIAKDTKLIKNELTSNELLEKRGNKLSEKPLNLTVDKISYPAYMINYECGLIWLNEPAQQLFYANASIPERAEDRSIIPTLLDWVENSSNEQKEALFVNHFNAVKHRLNRE